MALYVSLITNNKIAIEIIIVGFFNLSPFRNSILLTILYLVVIIQSKYNNIININTLKIAFIISKYKINAI